MAEKTSNPGHLTPDPLFPTFHFPHCSRLSPEALEGICAPHPLLPHLRSEQEGITLKVNVQQSVSSLATVCCDHRGQLLGLGPYSSVYSSPHTLNFSESCVFFLLGGAGSTLYENSKVAIALPIWKHLSLSL